MLTLMSGKIGVPMMNLELKKSYFEELLGKPMSLGYSETDVRTNMFLKQIREVLTLDSFQEHPDLDDTTITHFIKDSVHITVTVIASFMTLLDVEINELAFLDCGVSQEVETVKETGEVVCCFNCAGYDQEDGFCNYHERYTDEQAKCKHFEPNNG